MSLLEVLPSAHVTLSLSKDQAAQIALAALWTLEHLHRKVEEIRADSNRGPGALTKVLDQQFVMQQLWETLGPVGCLHEYAELQGWHQSLEAALIEAKIPLAESIIPVGEASAYRNAGYTPKSAAYEIVTKQGAGS